MDRKKQAAWTWLSKREQDILYLTMGLGKTSWEVGEMLGLAHYKYLEVKDRSEHFFRLFVSFLEKHPSLFRPDGPCQEDFKDYMEAVICDRKSRKESAARTGISVNLLSEVTNNKIVKNMRRLKESDNEWDQDTLKLINEFDRWNNFRILPKMLQQPSAYKRRLNKKDKIYIQYLLNESKMPAWLIERIKERFHFKTNKPSSKLYVALISKKLYKEGYKVISIKNKEEIVNEMSRFYIYVFSDPDDADSFGFMVANYHIKTHVVKLGLKFWPEYRETVQRALNYNQVNNMDFDTKTLSMAYEPLHKRPKKKKNKLPKPGLPRSRSEAFYK